MLTKEGVNTGSHLFSFVERLERLAEEKQGLTDDMKEVADEAKAMGFDKATLRKVIARRKMDPAARQEMDAMLELYEDAVTQAQKAQVAKSVAEGA